MTQPSVARYELATSRLAKVGETLIVAEQARAAAQSLFGRLGAVALGLRETRGVSSPVLSGRNADGSQIRRHDVHAFFLPTDDNNDGWIDHLTLWAPSGFTGEDAEALSALRDFLLPSRRVALAPPVFATPGDFAGLALFGPSRAWRSATPYLPHRRFQKSGRNRDPIELRHNPQALVRRTLEEELAKREETPGWKAPLPVRLSVHPFKGAEQFVLVRRRSQTAQACKPSANHAHYIEMQFETPVLGPLAVGPLCHYGLGTLQAMED